MARVFISYRREETSGEANHLAADLRAHFGRRNVFIDIDEIAPGSNFEDSITNALNRSRITLALIGRRWTLTTRPDGMRRLDDEQDYVRREIAAALAHEKVTVVPVLLEGAAMPAASALPSDIAPLTKRQAFDLSNKRWRYDVSRLSDIAQEHDNAWVRAWGRVRRRVRIVAPIAGLVLAAVVVVLVIVLNSDGPRPTGASTSPCGGDLSVGPHTSCAFAKRVEAAYRSSRGGATTVTAYSPATTQTYSMHCTAELPHVCTGGKGAAVYFTSGPSAVKETARSSSGIHACDQNISAGANTSCLFAENVFVSYWRTFRAKGTQHANSVTASSPVTNQRYQLNCTTQAGAVRCAGGQGALVTFSLDAVKIYRARSSGARDRAR
jgi:hypothetical protein